MRSISLPSLAWLLVGALFVQESRAEDYTRWHLPEGALARLGKGGPALYWGDRAVAYSPDGARLAVASGIGIWLYDADTGAEIALFTEQMWGVYSVAFSPDGTTLASGGKDTTVRLWDVASGQLTGTTQTLVHADFFVDGLLIGAGEDPSLYDDRSAVEPSSWGRIKGID